MERRRAKLFRGTRDEALLAGRPGGVGTTVERNSLPECTLSAPERQRSCAVRRPLGPQRDRSCCPGPAGAEAESEQAAPPRDVDGGEGDGRAARRTRGRSRRYSRGRYPRLGRRGRRRHPGFRAVPGDPDVGARLVARVEQAHVRCEPGEAPAGAQIFRPHGATVRDTGAPVASYAHSTVAIASRSPAPA
jgi:hypothetical protein